MTKLSPDDLAEIRERYEIFVGPEAEAMGFEEYSALYDEFVCEDLPRLVEHVRLLTEENEKLREQLEGSVARGRD